MYLLVRQSGHPAVGSQHWEKEHETRSYSASEFNRAVCTLSPSCLVGAQATGSALRCSNDASAAKEASFISPYGGESAQYAHRLRRLHECARRPGCRCPVEDAPAPGSHHNHGDVLDGWSCEDSNQADR